MKGEIRMQQKIGPTTGDENNLPVYLVSRRCNSIQEVFQRGRGGVPYNKAKSYKQRRKRCPTGGASAKLA